MSRSNFSLGIDTDNGAELINMELIAYCEQEHITFTRGVLRKAMISVTLLLAFVCLI